MLLFGTRGISTGRKFQAEEATTENARRSMVELFTRESKRLTPEEEREIVGLYAAVEVYRRMDGLSNLSCIM